MKIFNNDCSTVGLHPTFYLAAEGVTELMLSPCKSKATKNTDNIDKTVKFNY